MYLCCDRNNSIIGKAKTEKEAQEMCTNLGSSYIKIIPIAFWLMRNHNKFYTYNTAKGFLKHSNIVKKIKKELKIRYNIKNYNSLEHIDKVIDTVEEFFGDCSDMLNRKLRDSI